MTPSVAVITGAATGIGYEVARQLGTLGHTVVVTARTLDRAEHATQSLRIEGINAIAVELDVTSHTSVQQAATRVGGEFGVVHALVNNAGYWTLGDTPSSADIDSARSIMDTNLFGYWRTIQAFQPLLEASGRGRVVNVSSGAGSHTDPAGLTANGGPGASYAISKTAINGLTAAFAAEFKALGIKVNAVCPGFTATDAVGPVSGARPTNVSATGVVVAATLADDGPTGGFYRDQQPIGW